MINEFRNQHDYLSNFYQSLVEYEGLMYPSVEAAFQAAKVLDRAQRVPFTRMNPSQAKAAGRRVLLRSDWPVVKYQIMHDLCMNKFAKGLLKGKLLATGTQELIEGNYWHDNEWGHCLCNACRTREHKNHLGQILMQVRDEVQNQ